MRLKALRRLVTGKTGFALVALALEACGEPPAPPTEPAALLRLVGTDGEAAGLWFVDLGEAPIGGAAERTLTLRNDGTVPAPLALSRPDGAFTLELASAELPPGATTALVARFVPVGAGQREAIGSVRAGDARIDLRLRGVGRAGDASCLEVEPESIDFGGVIAGCEVAGQSVFIVNRCDAGTPVDFQVVPDGPIHLEQLPAGPVLVGAGDRLEVAIAYTPWSVGADEAGLLVGAGAGSAHRVELRGTGLPRPTREKVENFPPWPRQPLDVLVVVDDTVALEPWRDRLEFFAAEFARAANWYRIDLRLAVTTSSFDSAGDCGGTAGLLLPSEAPELLPHELPLEEFRDRLLARLDVDGCMPAGSGRPIEAALTAFARLERSESTARQIVVIAGEDDQGTMPVADLVSDFWAVEPRRWTTIVAVHPTTECGGTDDGARLVEFAARGYGDAVPICSNTWMVWNQLRVFNQPGYLYGLSDQPVDANGDGAVDEADLVVEIDGEVVERGEGGWTWRGGESPISIDPFRWTPHQTITIRYRVAAQLLCDG